MAELVIKQLPQLHGQHLPLRMAYKGGTAPVHAGRANRGDHDKSGTLTSKLFWAVPGNWRAGNFCDTTSTAAWGHSTAAELFHKNTLEVIAA